MAKPPFRLETGFADERIAKGLGPLRHVHIRGPNGFLAQFKDTPENREIARSLIDAANALSAPVAHDREVA